MAGVNDYWYWCDKELAEELASSIRSKDYWDGEELAKFCGLAGLAEEYEEADGESFVAVVDRAAKRLGVDIY